MMLCAPSKTPEDGMQPVASPKVQTAPSTVLCSVIDGGFMIKKFFSLPFLFWAFVAISNPSPVKAIAAIPQLEIVNPTDIIEVRVTAKPAELMGVNFLCVYENGEPFAFSTPIQQLMVIP